MQPFDALSIRAVLAEAKPLIVNRRVDRVNQLGRDEIVLSLRGKSGYTALFISAHSAQGRICLAPTGKQAERYQPKSAGNHAPVPNFCLLLRKHLAGAMLVAADQPVGERIADFVFSCTDEVGTSSIKILTAEIMGRHSNLIFWDRQSGKIVCASHNVTAEMSRQREIAPGLRYERPPSQDRPSIYTISGEDFEREFKKYAASRAVPPDMTPVAASKSGLTVEQWLINTFAGVGRHLAEELVLAAGPDVNGQGLFTRIKEIRQSENFAPFYFTNLNRFSIFGWLPEPTVGVKSDVKNGVKNFATVNEMLEQYFCACEQSEVARQLREKLRGDLKLEHSKLEARVKMASTHVQSEGDIDKLKKYGDLILAHLTDIAPGQELLEVEDIFEDSGKTIKIKLDPGLNTAQNAQDYYRRYARNRARHNTASQSVQEALGRKTILEQQLLLVERARDLNELKALRDHLSGRKPHEIVKPKSRSKKGGDSKVLSVQSSDGWTIYVGRNRVENDYLLSRLGQPNDLWFHVLGQGGAHVLIRIPSSKQEPPLATISEAAQIAARLSKATNGAKVRVIYTQCKYVKKLAKDKPGLVKYENERTIEVDTAMPMSRAVLQLFNRDS